MRFELRASAHGGPETRPAEHPVPVERGGSSNSRDRLLPARCTRKQRRRLLSRARRLLEHPPSPLSAQPISFASLVCLFLESRALFVRVAFASTPSYIQVIIVWRQLPAGVAGHSPEAFFLVKRRLVPALQANNGRCGCVVKVPINRRCSSAIQQFANLGLTDPGFGI